MGAQRAHVDKQIPKAPLEDPLESVGNFILSSSELCNPTQPCKFCYFPGPRQSLQHTDPVVGAECYERKKPAVKKKNNSQQHRYISMVSTGMRSCAVPGLRPELLQLQLQLARCVRIVDNSLGAGDRHAFREDVTVRAEVKG